MIQKDEKYMHLWEHLEELRWILFKIIGIVIITTSAAFFYVNEILELLMRPLLDAQNANPDFSVKIIMTTPVDGIVIKMKMAFLGGLLIACPFILYYIWSFLSAGMKKHEKEAFIWICGVGSFACFFGVVCGYHLIAPVLSILNKMGIESAGNFWTIREFINFEFCWLIGGGLIFELPLAIVILTNLGVIELIVLKRIRPFFYIAAFILSAIISPPDPFTMIMIGIPLIILYEFGIIIASVHDKLNQ